MKAALQNYRQSPRKVRVVADVIRGKNVNDALKALSFVPRRAAEPVSKVLKSAIANAVNNFQVDADSLFVKEVQVNKAVTLKRIMPRARGSASRINKRSSHISIILEVKGEKVTAISEKAVSVKAEKTTKKVKAEKVETSSEAKVIKTKKTVKTKNK